MPQISQREIARRLGVSVASVSRAIHGRPGIGDAVRQRVLAEVKASGYELDPVVSSGLSRVRNRQTYRETIAWCSDLDPREMPWLNPLYESAHDFAAGAGYRIEHFRFSDPSPRSLRRLASVWKARGIRGVMMGPMNRRHDKLPMPWNSPDLAWVVIGITVDHPGLHTVERDYSADLRLASRWLEDQGSRRPGFILDRVRHFFIRQDLLRAALWDRHRRGEIDPAIHELDPSRPEAFESWLRDFEPDGLVLAAGPTPPWIPTFRKLASLPTVYLSPVESVPQPGELRFSARYEVMGPVAVNTLHRLLRNGETGIPAYRHRVLVDSHVFDTMYPAAGEADAHILTRPSET